MSTAPTNLEVIQASEFVRLDAHEYLDFEATKASLRALALACQKRGLERAVVDLRSLPLKAKPHFTKTELAGLITTFREAGFSKEQRLAVLYSQDIHGGIRDFAFIGRLRGMQVQAFSDFEAATRWLSEGHGCVEEHPSGEVEVPITKRSKEVKQVPVKSISRTGNTEFLKKSENKK